MSDEPEEQQPRIIIHPEQLAGVWANRVVVSHSLHEFTLDFVRLDGTAPPPGLGIVVARVSVSPLLVTLLIDELNRSWGEYASRAFPREVFEGDEGEEESAPDA